MVPIIAHLIFAYSVLWWLSYELKKPFTPKKHSGWLGANVILGFSALALSTIDSDGIGNVLLHGIGGGMATACTYEYFKANLRLKINWRLDFVGLFFLVSTFGVLNEMYEFAADIAGVGGPYSIDRFDTWRDFYANTAGAVIVWLIVRFILRSRNQRHHD